MTTKSVPETDQISRNKQQEELTVHDRLRSLAASAGESPASGLLANPEVLVPIAIMFYEAALETFRRMS